MTAKAFSRPSLSFEGVPAAADLVALLGDADHPGTIVVAETPEVLAARPGLIPMKFAVPVLVLTAGGITAMLAVRFGGGLGGPTGWLFLAACWLVALPALLGLLVLSNHSFARKGDYFRVDKSRRELELCQLGRTFTAEDILAFTEVSRWYWSTGEWLWTRQTAVLVRSGDGNVELYPVVRESDWLPLRNRVGDRLAAVFQVPLHRTRLSWCESRALKDW